MIKLILFFVLIALACSFECKAFASLISFLINIPLIVGKFKYPPKL